MITTEAEIARDIAFEAFVREIESNFGSGSWRLAPFDVSNDAGGTVFEVTVPSEQSDRAPFLLATLTRAMKHQHGYRFTAIALLPEEQAGTTSGTERVSGKLRISGVESIEPTVRTVRGEEILIERHAITSAPFADDRTTEKTIRIPLSVEEVNVFKQAFVREEVEVGERSVEGTQHIAETLRYEEVIDENLR